MREPKPTKTFLNNIEMRDLHGKIIDMDPWIERVVTSRDGVYCGRHRVVLDWSSMGQNF